MPFLGNTSICPFSKNPLKISINSSLSEDIDSLLLFYKKPLETRFNRIIKGGQKVAPEIVDEIIDDALGLKASDIHFDPHEKEIIIRFRIDGFLHEAGRIPKEYYENILNRVKVQADMKIDEHFSAQDGAMRYNRKSGDRKPIDIRVSIVPTLDGEKIAIRLLSQYVRSFTLDDLGLSIEDQKLILSIAQRLEVRPQSVHE